MVRKKKMKQKKEAEDDEKQNEGRKEEEVEEEMRIFVKVDDGRTVALQEAEDLQRSVAQGLKWWCAFVW